MAEERKERKTHKVKAGDVKTGDLMAFIYYAKVNRTVDGGNQLQVTGVGAGAPANFEVNGQALVENSFSADQFHETVKITMTKAAELLISSHNRPLTVVFTKKDNTERRLRGRLLDAEPLLGRSYVEDLEVKDGSPVRLVDHRTIKMLIVDGVKYEVKK